MDSTTPNQKISPATWIGLFIALFGILIVRWAVSLFYPSLTFTATVWKESLTGSASSCSWLLSAEASACR